MKKIILLFSLLSALQHFSAAQNTIDSLQKILKNAGEDTTKVNILNTLSYELLYSNTDTTIYYATMAKGLQKN